jgi:WhiB family transcriptional regulator, redox-sensing transcriptional regulator
MHSPGTTAVLEAPAGFEAQVARAAVITRTGPVAAQAVAPPLPEPPVRPAGAEHVFRPAGLAPAPVAAAASPANMSGLPGGQFLPCTDDPELFFAESPQDVECAKALCRGCPARIACLSGAVERSEPWGVWGGELFLRGEIVPRKRPRGRPRKTEVAA